MSAGLEWLGRWMQEKHGLAVELEADPQADPAREDVRVLLFEAVRELLFNVVKHAGVARARVRLARAEGDQLELTISDQGRGFSPRAPQVRGAEGGGFGLFSIRERVGLLGGMLEIESALGRGTRVRLTARRDGEVPESARADTVSAARAPGAPALEAAHGQAAPPEAPAPPAAAPGSGLSRRVRILLADDHVVMRQGLSSLLAMQEDLEVVGEASTGREAVDRARQLRPDVILMDYSMPEMDGVEATRHVLREQPHVRIIGLSMFAEEERAAAMLRASAAAYLAKTGDTALLLEAVRGQGRTAP
ncbi:MAG: response regulator [Candidatus Latescibacterota bacterium]